MTSRLAVCGRPGRALLLALAALVIFAAAPAHAGIIAPEDAAELAQSLAEAQEEQDVCYGWNVTNNFGAGPDVGSSIGGPGAAVLGTASGCPKGVVVLEGSIDYACESCESSDSASVSIRSAGMSNPPTVEDLEALGLKEGGLTQDNDDTTLVNIVGALPLLVADRGNAPYVEYEQATTVPATDRATNKPGSDVLRDSWIWLVLCVLLILAGPLFYFYKRSQEPPKRKLKDPNQTSTGSRPTSEPPPAPPTSTGPAPPSTEPTPST